MNRPRESVLSLFDPLAGSSATPPRRDVHTPDSGSDKENALPPPPSDSPITLTKFFSRTYTRYKTLPAKLPNGGLIDFGDLTIDEDTDLDQLGAQDDSENDSEQDENAGAEQCISDATPQRRPLADIAIDEDNEATPIAVKRGPSAFAKPDDSLKAPNFSQLRPTAAPLSSPLAAVINSINGMPASPTSSTSSAAPGSPSETPRISVIPPEPSSPSPKPKPRPVTSTSTSSLDPRRISVDLQNSFSMHFNCPEASFDLMHDKISLGNETFLGTMDDSFDLAAEEATMNTLAQRLENVNLKEKSAVKKRAAQRKRQTDSESESEMELQENSLVERIRDVRLAVSDSESEDDVAPRMLTPMIKRGTSLKSVEGTPQAPLKQQLRVTSKPASPTLPPSEPAKPTELAVPAKADEDTPITPKNLYPPSKTEPPRLPPPPAAIRGLNIKKKTVSRPSAITSRPSSISSRPSTISARPSSISSTSTTSGSGSSSTRASISTSNSSAPDVAPKLTQAAPRPVRPKMVVTGVQRPPAGAALPVRPKDAGSTIGLRGHSAMSSESRRDGASATAFKYVGSMERAATSRVVGAGVQRPAVVSSKMEAPQEPSASRLQRAVSVSAGLSRKTSIPAAGTAGPAKAPAKSATSGLRPPSRIGGPFGGVSSTSRAVAAARPPVPTTGTSSTAIARSLRGEGRFGTTRRV